jgi:hypothetical protein
MLHMPAAEQTGCDSEPAGCMAHGPQVSPHWVTLWATQVPPHICRFEPHAVSHTPLELQAELVGHGSQSTVSSVPQKLLSELSTQAAPHRCRLAGHVGTHEVPLHVMLPPVGAAGHTVHVLPQEATLVLPLTTQVAFGAVPQE